MIRKLAVLALSIILFPLSALAASPVTVDDTAVAEENTTEKIYVLANDTDEDDDTLEIVSVTDPENGSTDYTSGDEFVEYRANTGFNGTDTFEYTISDGTTTDTGTVIVYVGAPGAPTNFRIQMEKEDGSHWIRDVSWDPILDENLGYNLYRGISPGIYSTTPSEEYDEFIDSQLETWNQGIPFITFIGVIEKDLTGDSTRYYIAITAVRNRGTDDQQESDPSNELIVDVYPGDDNPPMTPIIISAGITGEAQATIEFIGNNDDMIDLKNYELSYEVPGGEPVLLTLEKNINSKKINDLSLDTTYTFKVIARDYNNNTAESTGTSLLMESTRASLNPELFSGGCFVAGSMDPEPFWLPIGMAVFLLLPLCLICVYRTRLKMITAAVFFLLAFGTVAHAEEYKNSIGIKGGLLMSRDDNHQMYYEENEPWGLLYYERDLSYHDLSAEFEIGYMTKEGVEVTNSGEPTDTSTDLMLVPMILSLKYNYTVLPLISVFIGGGLDYWYYKEENNNSETDAIEDKKYGVGGYHGKAGVTLMTADEDWVDRAGVTFEFMYSKIDKFGKNEIDLGGMSFNASLFYKF